MDLEYVLKCEACRKYFALEVDVSMSAPWNGAVEWAIKQYGPKAACFRPAPSDLTDDPIFREYVYQGEWTNVSNHFFFHDRDKAFEFKVRWG
jgi:hypothetical protein